MDQSCGSWTFSGHGAIVRTQAGVLMFFMFMTRLIFVQE